MFPKRRHLLPPPTTDENHKCSPHQNYYSLRRRSHYPMGSDGGSGSGLPSPDDPTTTTPAKILNKYYPKIYSYKCYGKYSTTSNLNDKKNNGGGGGKCYGIAKAMETLYNEPVRMSRIEALQRFTSMNSDVDLDDYNQHHSHHDNDDRDSYHNNRDGSSSVGELSEQAVYLSPALIYKYENNETVESGAANESNKVVYDPTTKNEKNMPEVQYYDDRLLEEEVILEQDWTCYGVTDVEYLSLEDVRTGESKLVAVAPRNTGLSIRNIETDDHLRSLTRCSLGWIDILHDSNSVLGYEDEVEENEAKKNSAEEANKKFVDKGSLVEKLVDMLKSSENTDEGKVDEQIRRTPSIFTELQAPKDVEWIIKIGQEHIHRTFEFSKLVSTHMQYNAQWFYNNLKDDFPNRTMEAGKRFITQIPTTVDGTVTTMNRIVQYMIRGRDDDDDDDNNFSGGRRF